MYFTHKVKEVKINGMEMEYAVFGEGDKPLVIIPGLSVKSVIKGAGSIASAYRRFGEDFKIYVFDRRKNISEGYNLRNMADDTAAAMKEIGIKNACIFGASQGGMIAQYIAIFYPELVGKLILGSSMSRFNKTADKILREWIGFAERGDITSLNESFAENLYTEKFSEMFREMMTSANRDATQEDLRRFILLAKACEGFDAYSMLDRIKCPTLVIGAKHDRVLTGQASVEMAEKLGCELYMYEDYGHCVYDEALDYKDRMYAFFKSKYYG